VILDHVVDAQAFYADCLVLTNNACRELMLVVPSSIGNPGIDASNFATSFLTVLTALCFLESRR
jgi:hypothetical protein